MKTENNNAEKTYVLGALPSPIDIRDYLLEAVVPDKEVPDFLDLRDGLLDVRDQGRQGSCSAMTASCIKDWQERKDIELKEYTSPQFVYNNRKNQTSSGMFPRDTMKILQNMGICLEKEYPYGKLEPKEKISKKVYKSAINFAIQSYARVDTVKGLKKALLDFGPCYMSVPVYNYGDRMWLKREGDTLRGLHALTVVGYTYNGFILRNSWGEDWNGDGHTVFPYIDWGKHCEVWSTVDLSSASLGSKWSLFFKKIFWRIKRYFISLLEVWPLWMIMLALSITLFQVGDTIEGIIPLIIALITSILAHIKNDY